MLKIKAFWEFEIVSKKHMDITTDDQRPQLGQLVYTQTDHPLHIRY
jgi:hypothetical protein